MQARQFQLLQGRRGRRNTQQDSVFSSAIIKITTYGKARNGDKAGSSDVTGNGDKAGNSNIAGSIAGNCDIAWKRDKASSDVDWNSNKAGSIATNGDKAGSIAGNGGKTGNDNKAGSVAGWEWRQSWEGSDEVAGNDDKAWTGNEAWKGDITGNFDKAGSTAGNGNKAGNVVWNDNIAGCSDKAWNVNKEAGNGNIAGSVAEKGHKAISEVAWNCDKAGNVNKEVGNSYKKAGNGYEEAGNGDKPGNNDEEALDVDKEVGNGDETGNVSEAGNDYEAWIGNETGNCEEAWNGEEQRNSDIVWNHDVAWNGDKDGNNKRDIISESDESDESEVFPMLSVTGKQIWGSVTVIQQGRHVRTFPMHSTVLAIGSSRSNDIIVKNATPHEVILQVNRRGEVFSVCGHEVKVLHHKECFYVGGRQFKWCYPLRKDENVNVHVARQGMDSDKGETCVESENSKFEKADKDRTDIASESDESDESEVFPVLSVSEQKEAMHLLKKYERLKKKYKKLKKAGADTTVPKEPKGSCSTTDFERKSSNDKKLACVFCGKLLVHRITEHWTHEHSDELEVAEIHSSTGNKKKILTQKLRNRGNFKHNIKVLQGGGDIFIPVKQCKSAKLEDFLPCTSCYGFYQGKELWRHYRNCPFNTCQQGMSGSTNVQAEARLMLRAAVLPDSVQSEDAKILEMLKTRKDDIGQQIEGDSLILKMTKVLWNKLGSRRKNDISQRARQLARLKMEINRQKKEQCELIDFICGKKYDCVIEAVHNLAGLHENEENVKRFEKPGLALRIGHNLVKACEIKIGMCLRNDDEVGLKEGETFLKLLKAEWKDSVSSVALATLKTNKFNKGEVLPLTEDLKNLKIYLDNRIEELTSQFKSPSYATWRELAEVTLARILIFNKRRSAEASKLLLSAYNERPNWREKANQEIFDSLTELEQNMFNRMDMIETQGKMDKKVPTLLTSQMVHAIDKLNEYRSLCGIKAVNKYIFANQENGHLDSWQVLNKVAVKAGCKNPELINSVSLRKYIATVSQILDLNDGEVQWLSSHLAHTVKTHKDFYRLQSAAVEIGKVSKLLLLTENGDVSKFRGKSLEEIQIDDSVAFDKGDIDEEKGLYDIAEEDSLDEELTQDERSETNPLSHGGSMKCPRNSQCLNAESKVCPKNSPHPHELNLNDEHLETNIPSHAGGEKQRQRNSHCLPVGRVKCPRKSPQPRELNLSDEHSETNLLCHGGGEKRQRNSQHLPLGRVKRPRKSPHPHELNLSDSDSDDSVRDPTFMDTDSSSNDEQPPPEVQTKHYKQRWSPDELQIFNRIFSSCLKEKLMPTGTILKIAAKQLSKRTIAQIRTRVHNIIKGKQSS